MEESKIDLGVRSAAENLMLEEPQRVAMVARKLNFGVPYLDLATGGILPSDLVLVTARTGGGKTEFLTQVACHNALEGKRILFFALEAAPLEMERRMKFRMLAQMYFADTDPFKVRDTQITYRNWYMGGLSSIFAKYESEVESEFKKKFKQLFLCYRRGEFTVKIFENILLSYQEKVDLVIVDHLNFFDFDESTNEQRAVSQIVKRINDVRDSTNLPVLLAAHIRKPMSKDKSILPDLEDIHGTSNVPKISTKAIVLAASHSQQKRTTEFGTYMRVAKARLDNSVSRYVAHVTFDMQTNSYSPQFQIGKYMPYQEEFQPLLKGEVPEWAL